VQDERLSVPSEQKGVVRVEEVGSNDVKRKAWHACRILSVESVTAVFLTRVVSEPGIIA
jgi:hypothetical protein